MSQRFFHISCFTVCLMAGLTIKAQDPVADQMLLYQRSIGGWPKQVNEVKVDYTKPLSAAEQAGLLDDKFRNDATIDNNATTREIRYLVQAYGKTGNAAYLKAAEKGVRYLLLMQHANGGFPQFYPDSSSYRNEITYNDNAMINALEVLWDVVHGREGLNVMDRALVKPSEQAIRKGIECILATQIRVKGKLRGWCAQYNERTMQPAKARSFELVSISGMESVGIVRFLMKIEQPSKKIMDAVDGAVEWLRVSALHGYRYVDIKDPQQPNGRDRVLQADPSSTVWARFYDVETNRPFFCGRDGVKKWNVAEIENERRTGYAWYGTWPQVLLDKEYVEWKTKKVIHVRADGSGDFISIQAAINSLPDSAANARIIEIAPGTYHEKLWISKHNITLRGTDRDHTVITCDIARDEWRCDHPDDWGAATLNLNGNDITLENLTIANDYGFNHKEQRTIDCHSDSAGKKVITNAGHQMALRSMRSTRLRAINCRFRAYAGDTVSPWNLVDGMFYFRDCIMEGGVDFYCPRGWAWAEHCRFYANTGVASIWHDGSGNPDFKTVLKDCQFDGFDGFRLGRYHKDAQFYLVNCHFSRNMADQDIYLVPTSNVLKYGRRVYYLNCHRDGGDYAWFHNNLDQQEAIHSAGEITPAWLFGNRWHPENN